MDIPNGGPSGFSGLGMNSRGHASGEDNRALVVAASPINRIVIAHTLEKIYLKPNAVAPQGALAALRASSPIVAIIDDSGAGDILEALLNEVAGRSKSSERGLPRVVLIGRPEDIPSVSSRHTIDAVVTRPFTPDTLQPIVERVVAAIRTG